MDGVKLIVGDKCMGCWISAGQCSRTPNTSAARYIFYHNVFSVVPQIKIKIVTKILRRSTPRSKKASREKAKAVVAELRAMEAEGGRQEVETVSRRR